MNMHCASRLGWIRSSKEASPHAPEELADPAQARSAASGRTTGTMPSQRLADRTPRAPAPHRVKRSGLLLLATATLLLIPALAYADVPVATITGLEFVAEGTPAEFTVALAGGKGSADVVVTYTVGGTATEGLDYVAPEGAVTFVATDNSVSRTIRTFSITPIEDSIDERDETLVVTLTAATTAAGTAVVGTPSSVITTVKPAGTKIVTVTAPEDVTEGETATFTVQGEIDSDLNVRYETVAGTATSADYTSASASGTVTLQEGNNPSVPITVITTDDTLTEGDETFSVKFSLVNPPADVVLGTSMVTATIAANDSLTASVRSSQESLVEGSDATFTVTLTGGVSSEDVVISYDTMPSSEDEASMTTDPAITGEDYDSPSGTLIIPAGQTMGIITIPTSVDDVRERPETLRVTLRDATTEVGMAMVTSTATDASISITIGDRDGSVTVSLAENITVNEGDMAKFVVRLSGEVSEEVRVSYRTVTGTGTGAATPDDFTSETGTLSISAGDTARTISVATTDDDAAPRAEAPEWFVLELQEVAATPPLGVSLGVARARARATIIDDDVPVASVKGLETLAEGEMARFTVTLDEAAGSEAVLIEYTVGGTAVAGEDYEVPSGELSILAEMPSGDIVFRTIADEDVNETLTLTLVAASTEQGRATIGTPRAATTTLAEEGVATLSVADRHVSEGDDAVFEVTLSKAVDDPVRVKWDTAAGTATATTDYGASSASGTVTIAAEAETAMFTVDTVVDGFAERSETFNVALSLVGEPANVVAGAQAATATATILDGNPLSANVTTAGRSSVPEGSEATFTVVLTGGTSTAEVVVTYEVGAGDTNGVVAGDFRAPGTSLRIPAGESSGPIVVATNADDVREPPESLRVTLTEAKMGDVAVVLGAPPDPEFAEVTIEEPVDDALVTVAATSVTEGAPVVFTVTLSGKVSQDLALTYVLQPGITAVGGEDYTAADLTGSLVIKMGMTRETFTVRTIDDDDAENEETLGVTLTLPTGNESAGRPWRPGPTSATAAIRDNERLRVGVEGPQRLVRNGSGNFQITLDGGVPTADIEVHYTLGDTTDSDTITRTNVENGTLPPIAIPTSETGTVSVTLNRLGPTAGTATLGTRTARTEIMPDGTETVKVEVIGTPSEQSRAALFRITRVAATGTPIHTGDVTVTYGTQSGSATTADYTTKTGSEVFSAGGDSATVTVAIEDDDLVEGVETFSLRISRSLPTGVEYETMQATARITDGDTSQATVASGQPTVVEGETAMFPVTLTNAFSAPVVINYDVGGTATENEDYTAPSGSLTIPAGQKTGTIKISTLVDDVLEPLEPNRETLTVALSGATSSAGDPTFSTTAVGTKIGDRGGTVTVSVTATSVTEGAPVVFTVTLSGKVSQDLALTYVLQPGITAVGGEDYTAADLTGSLVIKMGMTRETFTVRTIDDDDAENEETLGVTLTLPTGNDLPAGVAPGTTSATAAIRDNERLRVGVEGPQRLVRNGSGNFQITLDGGVPTADIEVHYTLGDTTDSDTITRTNVENGTLPPIAIPTSETGTVSVTLNRLGPTAGTATLGTRTARTEIMPDGTETVKVEVIGTPSEQSRAALFRITRVAATGTPIHTGDVTVTYGTQSGSATTADYTTKTGSEVFSAGGDSATVTSKMTTWLRESRRSRYGLAGVYRPVWSTRPCRQRPGSLMAIRLKRVLELVAGTPCLRVTSRCSP